jgi:probable F420-dependent oxidoreductase
VKFGLCLPTFETIATREAIVRAAQFAEEGDWDSVWVTDHILMATGQEHPYGHLFEAITSLAYVAGMTHRVKLGTSILVLPARNAIVVAKEIAALDQLSQGRVILGIAPGWNEREFGFLGAPFHQRGRLIDEQIAVMRALWSQKSPSFSGKFYQFKDTLFSPKPVQTNIPIWIGGNSPAGFKRAARLGDGWHVTGSVPDSVKQTFETMRPMIKDRAFTLSVRSEVTLDGKLPIDFNGPDGSPRRRLGPTTTDMIRDVEAYRNVGVEYMVFVLRDDELIPMEKHIKEIAREVLPKFK